MPSPYDAAVGLTSWQAGAQQAASLPGIVEIAVSIDGGLKTAATTSTATSTTLLVATMAAGEASLAWGVFGRTFGFAESGGEPPHFISTWAREIAPNCEIAVRI